MKRTQQSDWKNEPMPISSKVIEIDAVFTPEEFQSIALGCIPNQMEDKWFMYYDEPWFYIHRSWTGYCIYKVRFEECATGVKIAEVIANRESGQYMETDDASDARLLKVLLGSRAKQDVKQQMLNDIKLRNVDK
jgi:hypothetical protein